MPHARIWPPPSTKDCIISFTLNGAAASTANATLALADHVIILGAGVVAAQGTPAEVRASTDPLVHQFVNALPTGPVPFHYPGPTAASDFGPLDGRSA